MHRKKRFRECDAWSIGKVLGTDDFGTRIFPWWAPVRFAPVVGVAGDTVEVGMEARGKFRLEFAQFEIDVGLDEGLMGGSSSSSSSLGGE